VRTIAALRGAFYNALTTPALQYQIDLNTPQTVASTSVFPRAVYAPTSGGSATVYPAIFIDVSGGGDISQHLYGEQKFGLKVWVVSTTGPDEATAIFEALDKRLNFADQIGGWDATDLSTAGSGSSLPVIVRQIKSTRVSGAAYELDTNKWYVTADYSGIAH
jgi:hypothetical protein